MIKIVEIIPILSIRRGAETFFANLCTELCKRKEVKLSIILLYDEIDESFKEQLKNLSIKIYFCHKHKGIDFKASKLFRKILREINPDVIHTHNCCLFTYFLAFGFKRQKWNYFHTCHSVPSNEATALEHKFRKIFAKKHLMTNIAISSAIQKEFAKKYKVEDIKKVVNGIPLKEQKDIKKTYDFINVANFDKVKNHDLLLKSFAKVVAFNKDLLLVLVGKGNELNRIKLLVKDLNIDKNVIFTGQVSDVSFYLSKARCFVLSSNFEGLPISLLEAMNFGLPIISTNVGGVSEIIKEKNGILVEPNNVDALYNAMLKIITNKELEDNFKRNNLLEIKNYTIEACANEYLKIFKESIRE